MKKRAIDFVILAYNEAENIDAMVSRTVNAFEAIGVKDFRMIFVENGSSDNRVELLEAHAKRDPRIVGLSLSRNFGPQGAIQAGLSVTDANYVCIMDGINRIHQKMLHKCIFEHAKQMLMLRLCSS